MACPYLDYRASANDQAFEEPRAYCAVVDRFVQPMRADICNDRFNLEHSTDCEIFQNASEGEVTSSGPEDTTS